MEVVENFIGRIPYDELLKIGLTKSDLLKWKQEDITKFMSGHRTGVMLIAMPLEEGKNIFVDAKLLLKEINGEVHLNIVPVRSQLKNDYSLTEQEKIKLYAGKLLSKNIEGQRYVLQLDRETNEIVRARTSDVKLPFELQPGAKEKLYAGKNIEVETTQGIKTIKLDLLNVKRYAFEDDLVEIRYPGRYFRETQLLREDIKRYKLSELDVHQLLDGYRTRLLNMPDGEKGRLGLRRNEDGSASLERFVVKNELNNDIQLNSDEIDRLKRGEVVSSKINGKMYLVQLDKETNDLIRKQKDHILPETIRGIELKSSDKDRLLAGQTVSMKDSQTGESVSLKIDLSHMSGLSIKDDTYKLKMIYMAGKDAKKTIEKIIPNSIEREKFVIRNRLDKEDLANYARAAFDERQKFAYDWHNYGFSSYIQTDRNKWESMVFTHTQKTPVPGMRI